MEGLFQPMHLLVILVIVLLIFGPKKLGDLGKGLGEGIRNFKSSMNEGNSTNKGATPPSATTTTAPAPTATATTPAPDATTTQLSTIIVTAQRRSENIHDVPISMQALTGQSMQQLNIQTFDDYVK